MHAEYDWNTCNKEYARAGTKIGAHILDLATAASTYQKHIGPTLHVGPKYIIISISPLELDSLIILYVSYGRLPHRLIPINILEKQLPTSQFLDYLTQTLCAYLVH